MNESVFPLLSPSLSLFSLKPFISSHPMSWAQSKIKSSRSLQIWVLLPSAPYWEAMGSYSMPTRKLWDFLIQCIDETADVFPLNIISHSIILMYYYINHNLFLISLRLHIPAGRWVIGENRMRDNVVIPQKDDDGDDDKSNMLSPLLRAFY